MSEKGERLTVTVNAKFDSEDYPITGSPFADTVVYQRVDSHTLKGTVKKAGRVVVAGTPVVSKDGKILTVTYCGVDNAGKQPTRFTVLEK